MQLQTLKYSDETLKQLFQSGGYNELVFDSHGNYRKRFTETNTPVLGIAAAYGCNDVVCKMLADGYEVDEINDNHQTPLLLAIDNAAHNNNRKEVTRLLIEGKCNVNHEDKKGMTPLVLAAERMNANMVQQLVKARCDVNRVPTNCTMKQSALHKAAENNDVHTMRVLIAAKCDINIVDDLGNTALITATQNNGYECAKKLVKAGCNLNMQGEQQYSALHIAVDNGDEEITCLLLNAKCDTDIADETGWRALHFAAAFRHDTLIKALIKAGCNVNVTCPDGTTPLDLAIENDYTDEGVLLFNAGCESNCRHSLDKAVEFENAIFVEKLLEKRYTWHDVSDYYVVSPCLYPAFRRYFAETFFAFALGSHKRLGDRSFVFLLHEITLMDILAHMVVRKTIL